MNDIDKILELLDKGELSSEEKKALDGLLAGIPGSEKIVNTYARLKKALAEDSHIDEVLIGEYVLFKNDILEDKRTMLLLERKIEDHLRKCTQCTDVFRKLNEEYTEVDSFLGNTLTESKVPDKKTKITAGFFRRITPVKTIITSFAALIIIYIGMFAASSILVPDYKKYAISEDERGMYNTRGRTSELFQKSLSALDNNNLTEAIKLLEEDIELNKGESSIFYSHFILGVTYIQSSELSFLGTFKSFDKEKIKSGITNLERSIQLNSSGRYENLNLDAHYFIGKAHVLVGENKYAIEQLETVVSNKGSYYKKAEELLDKINKR